MAIAVYLFGVIGVLYFLSRNGAAPRALAITAGGAAVLFAWLSWPPDELAIARTCRPSGVWADLSETVHGQRFWQSQLRKLQAARAGWEEMPARTAARRARMAAIVKSATEQAARVTKGVLPEPTPAQQAAQALRDRADEIEDQESQRQADEWMMQTRAENLEWLARCEVLARRAAGSNA